MHRSLSKIAGDIKSNWDTQPSGVYFGAKPYLEAMRYLDQITDTYGADNSRLVVLYFLSNADTWRGETARRIKKELRSIAGV